MDILKEGVNLIETACPNCKAVGELSWLDRCIIYRPISNTEQDARAREIAPRVLREWNVGVDKGGNAKYARAEMPVIVYNALCGACNSVVAYPNVNAVVDEFFKFDRAVATAEKSFEAKVSTKYDVPF